MKVDGKAIALEMQQRHRRLVAQSASHPLRLTIFTAGQSSATKSFIKAKKSYGKAIGVDVEIIDLAPNKLLEGIRRSSRDPKSTGIVVQLPLSNQTLTTPALAAVSTTKDVDGLGPNSPYQISAIKAILLILQLNNISIKDKRVAVVGQGTLVGRPVSATLEQLGARVDRCDISTEDLAKITRDADIIISATGVPRLITEKMVSDKAFILDAGSGISAGRIAGDVDTKLYTHPTIHVTPVPGGVGPVTVAALFDNFLIAAS